MIDYTYSNLFFRDSTITNIIIYDEETGATFGNDKVYFEELKVNESISFLQDLNYGSCTAGGIELKMRSDVGNLKGKTITISLVLDDHTDEPFVLGTYNVKSDNLQANEGSRVIEAYDSLYEVINADVAEWYNNIYENDEEYTIKYLRNSLLSQFEITEEDTTLVNDSVLVKKTIKPFQLSGYDVLSCICEINGVFAHIGRDGVLRYIRLDDSDPYTITLDKYVRMDYQSYNTAPIDGVQIRQEENDIGGSYPANVETDNGLIIEDNFLMYGKSTDELNQIASRLYDVVHSVTYMPISLTAMGNPCIEVGDCIRVQTTDGNYIKTYVLDRTLEGIQTMGDDIEALGNEERDTAINSIQSRFMQLKGQTATLEHTVDGLTSTVTTIEGNYVSQSQLQQTSDRIDAQIETIQKELDGDIFLYYTNEQPTLLNYPAWEFTISIPCNNTVQLRDDLAFEYTEESYRQNLRSIAYDETTNIGYRFVKTNGVWGWVEIADTETTLILQKIAELEITSEGIRADVAQISQDYVTNEILQSTVTQSATQIQSTVSETYETKGNASTTKQNLQSQITQTSSAITSEVTRAKGAENALSSRITQTDESITSEVSRAKGAEGTLSSRITQNANNISLKVSKGAVSSEISVESGQVTLRGNRLIVDSSNFGLDANGNVRVTGQLKTIPSDSGFYTDFEGAYLESKDKDTQRRLWSVGLVSGATQDIGMSFDAARGGWKVQSATNDAIKSHLDHFIINYNSHWIASPFETLKTDDITDKFIFHNGNMRITRGDLIFGSMDNYLAKIQVNRGDPNKPALQCSNNFYVTGDFICTGAKNRAVDTKHYGKRTMNAFETATSNFGDVGSGAIVGDRCEIILDPIYCETVALEKGYQVLITRTSEAETSWVEKLDDRFIVHGKDGATFDWMIIARQKDYADVRLKEINL